jgi:hypothetical protein
MARQYRSKGQGVTGDRSEARANRKLQLIVSQSHPGERGYTLLEKMEMKLDQTVKARQELIDTRNAAVDAEEKQPGKAFWSDELEDEYLDNMLKNEGKVQGMLIMLGIMRSTGMKTELTRSKARISHGVKPHSTER